jgi:hypothetical protein
VKPPPFLLRFLAFFFRWPTLGKQERNLWHKKEKEKGKGKTKWGKRKRHAPPLVRSTAERILSW